jgi:hypothetical protein
MDSKTKWSEHKNTSSFLTDFLFSKQKLSEINMFVFRPTFIGGRLRVALYGYKCPALSGEYWFAKCYNK